MATSLQVHTFSSGPRSGDDGVSENGREPFTGKPFVYKTSIAKPGFVRLYAMVVDAADKPFAKKLPKFTGDPTTREGKRALKKSRKMKKHLFFDGGAGADIDTLRQGAPEPADFDAFWTRQKAELAKVPFNAKRVEIQSGNPDARLHLRRQDKVERLHILLRSATELQSGNIHVPALRHSDPLEQPQVPEDNCLDAGIGTRLHTAGVQGTGHHSPQGRREIDNAAYAYFTMIIMPLSNGRSLPPPARRYLPALRK